MFSKNENRKRGMIYIINAIDTLSLKLDSCPLSSKLWYLLRSYGPNPGLTFPWPPLALQASGPLAVLKWDHSPKLAFPKMMAPAFLNLDTTPASQGTTEPSNANEPAVVFTWKLSDRNHK